MSLFGTRPEAIKMAPLIKLLETKKNINSLVCVTAQHRKMLDQVLDLFKIIPNIDLNLMKPNQDLFDITSNVMINLRDVYRKEKPDLVLLHGDTTTTMSAAMAAFYEGIKIGHVEAGLRTYNLKSPFPEEFNRQVLGRLSNIHFSPTKLSKNNLLKEGVNEDDIIVTGNTVIDSLFLALSFIDKDKNRLSKILKKLKEIVKFDFMNKKFVLITAHRRENFGRGLNAICDSILNLSISNPQVHFVFSLHLNPNVRNLMISKLNNIRNIHLIEPLSYELFIILLRQCYLVLTDSGGLQEEAPSLGKPVLVMRKNTERPEAIEAGTVNLVGIKKEIIEKNVNDLISNKELYNKMSEAYNPYGDGKACGRIVEKLLSNN